MSNWRNNRNDIGQINAQKIEIITNGKFKAIDLCPKHNDTSNAQNRANHYKSVVTNQESKNKESVASVTSQSDAYTLTQDFSNVSKLINVNPTTIIPTHSLQ